MPRKEPGVRRHGKGFQVYLEVRGQHFSQSFPINTPPAEMREWRRNTRHEELKRLPPAAVAGTLAKDIERYLKTLSDRPKLQKERAHQLAWWADRFGHRRRHSIRRDEWRAALADLATRHSPSTVRHYRTAMFHLYTTLDGKDAPNPLREIAPPRSADPEPRALPYPVIDAIFAVMPDRGQGLRHEKRSLHSKTKARLKVMAYVSLPPEQIRWIDPEDLDLDSEVPSVMVQGRKKGKGSKSVRLPLTPQGVQAFREFVAADAFERTRPDGTRTKFSTSSARTSWWRAIRLMVDRLAQTDWRAARSLLESLQRVSATPYDLRHSLLTESFLASGNIRATQALAMHSDARMTERYTLAAVNIALKAVVDQLGTRLLAGVSAEPPPARK